MRLQLNEHDINPLCIELEHFCFTIYDSDLYVVLCCSKLEFMQIYFAYYSRSYCLWTQQITFTWLNSFLEEANEEEKRASCLQVCQKSVCLGWSSPLIFFLLDTTIHSNNFHFQIFINGNVNFSIIDTTFAFTLQNLINWFCDTWVMESVLKRESLLRIS